MAKDKRLKTANPQTKPSPAVKAAAAAAVTTPPDWPAFKPPLPVVDLEFDSLVEDKVVVLRSFFPKNLCRDYVSFLRTLPLITTPGKPKRGDAVRVNDRFQIQDPRFADRLWLETGLKEAVLRDEVSHLWYVIPAITTRQITKAHEPSKQGGPGRRFEPQYSSLQIHARTIF